MDLFSYQNQNEKSSPWSISEFTSRVKYALESAIPSCWVRGEVSNLRIQSSGHAYFSLKDSGSQVSCVFFRGNRSKSRVALREGMELILLGEISVYEPRGNYQLIVREVIESGEGKLQIEFERLKQKLASEGLFDKEKKRPLPIIPQKIALITSPSGAALQDFIEILQRRKFTGSIFVFPSLMQGEQAAGNVIQQLDLIEKSSLAEMVVITRGGGSMEDLWAFNNEALARHIAAFSLPVISAIGHEIDFTLTDFVADVRAETPSGAAELISSAFLEQLEILQDCEDAIQGAWQEFFRRAKDSLSHQRRILANLSPQRRIETLSQRMDDLQMRLQKSTEGTLQRRKDNLGLLAEKIAQHSPRRKITQYQEQLNHLAKELSRSLLHKQRTLTNETNHLEKRLENCSYQKVLQRGYAIVRNEEDKPLTSRSAVQSESTIKIELHDGTISIDRD